ncbi:MAG: leucine-rich repeat domain-containing protein [Bacteroidales bacterium]|nr:leucine-rich repeat domain-containing protein [Bacteroidales bacterium]
MNYKFRHFFAIGMLLLLGNVANAYDFQADGIFYKVISMSERTVEVTFKELEFDPNNVVPSYAGVVTVPATVDYQGVSFRVTAIGENAFKSCAGLSKVILPVGLRVIGGYAFSDCTGLTDVDIPNTVTTISDCAFERCHAFTHVVIPASVTEIGGMAFSCEGVQTLTIEDSPEWINAGGYWGRAFAFPNILQAYIGRNCGGWQAPSSLIDNWYQNGKLQRVEFGPYVTEIPYCILYGDAYNLTELVLSPNIKKIAWGGLSGCYALKRLVLPDAVEEIEDYALSGGWGDKPLALTDLVIGSRISRIGENTFTGCLNLQSITVRRPDAISIPENAFHAQTYMTATLYVPKGSKVASEQQVLVDELIRTQFEKGELDSLQWAQWWEEYWLGQNYPKGYYSDTVRMYETKEVPGYSQTAYWSNFLRIEEGEGAAVTRWPFTVEATGGGTVQALGKQVRNTTMSEYVEEGTDVNILLVPDYGYVVDKVLLNGKDVIVIPELNIQTFTIPAINGKETLSVSFKAIETSLLIRTSEQGALEQTVAYGTACTFRITAADGYVLHSVVFNDTDVTSEVQSDGSYTTPNITGKAILSVAFEADPSAISTTRASAMRVLPYSQGISVQGLTRGETIAIYATDGSLVAQRRVSAATEYIALPVGQVYIVNVEGRSVKVML